MQMIKIFNNQLAGFLLFSGYQIAEIDGQPISKNCIYGFNKEPGIKRTIDAFALSTMLQWMFRSRLRKQPPEPVKIYIPSTRMRQLLIEWLNGNR